MPLCVCVYASNNVIVVDVLPAPIVFRPGDGDRVFVIISFCTQLYTCGAYTIRRSIDRAHARRSNECGIVLIIFATHARVEKNYCLFVSLSHTILKTKLTEFHYAIVFFDDYTRGRMSNNNYAVMSLLQRRRCIK